MVELCRPLCTFCAFFGKIWRGHLMPARHCRGTRVISHFFAQVPTIMRYKRSARTQSAAPSDSDVKSRILLWRIGCHYACRAFPSLCMLALFSWESSLFMAILLHAYGYYGGEVVELSRLVGRFRFFLIWKLLMLGVMVFIVLVYVALMSGWEKGLDLRIELFLLLCASFDFR